MNAPLRRMAVVCLAMIVTLLISTTWIQFASAGKLNDDPRNRRSIIEQAGRHRGPILAGNLTLAESVKSEGQYAFQRRYPANQLYAHTTGFFPIDGSPLGLESSESKELSGVGDEFFYRRMSDLLLGKQPKGATVETTIDPKVQQIAWDALGNQRGAVVAVDPVTGAILAMVSKPSYDPNVLATHSVSAYTEAFTKLEQDPLKPLINRAIGGDLYPPGSVFKVITAAAGLESGRYTPETLVDGSAELTAPGTQWSLTNDWKGPCTAYSGTTEPGKITMNDALRQSCNTAFGAMAMDLGAETMQSTAAKFGFGEDLRIPLRVTPSTIGSTFDQPALAMTGIGQRDVRVTPLQVAMMSAAVANGGEMMKPHLVKSVLAEDQSTIRTTAPEKLSRATSAQTAFDLADMMRTVVEKGTGTKAQIPGVSVAGKTGTAEQGAPGSPPHAWFTGFAPAGQGEKPRVAVAVVVEAGGIAGDRAHGGTTAAPIAQKVMKAVLGQ